MPLIRGKYAETSWVAKVTGNKANVNQSNLPVRSNMEYLGLGGAADIAIGATGVCLSVPVPVEFGDVISAMSVMAGATAESGGSHAFMALYAGTGASPALLGQTADDTGAASIAASTVYTKSLATPVLITPSNAPNGFVYATIAVTGTPPTLSGCAPLPPPTCLAPSSLALRASCLRPTTLLRRYRPGDDGHADGCCQGVLRLAQLNDSSRPPSGCSAAGTRGRRLRSRSECEAELRRQGQSWADEVVEPAQEIAVPPKPRRSKVKPDGV
jgi:hypothetical protein